MYEAIAFPPVAGSTLRLESLPDHLVFVAVTPILNYNPFFSSPASIRMIAKSSQPTALTIGFVLAISSHFYAHADLIGVTGDIQIVSPPPSVKIGDLESSTLGIVFQERSDYQLLADTRVSIPGAIGVYDEKRDMRPTDSLLAGSIVNSYILHFDTDFGAPQFQGTVQFSDPIVGVMLLPFALDSSDAELGALGTLYPTNASLRRGLDFEDSTPLDTLEVLDDRTIGFDLSTSNVIDQIRVVTSAASVPEPSSAVLLSIATAVFGLHLLLRRPQSSNWAVKAPKKPGSPAG